MMIPSSPSSEESATMDNPATCKQPDNAPSQEFLVSELTARLAIQETELRFLHREKAHLESKRNMKGSSVELAQAYESLMKHLDEREEEFKGIAEKNATLVKRQAELEKITRELHNTMKFQRSLMHEKTNKVNELQKQLEESNGKDEKEMDSMRRQVTVALEEQRAAAQEKNELGEKLAATEKIIKRMQAEIDQHIMWQNETMRKSAEQEKVLTEKESEILDLHAKNSDLKTKIDHHREVLKDAKIVAEQKDSMLESAQEEITRLHSKNEKMYHEIREQKRVINVFEQRFVTKGQNIMDLNARVVEADKMWAKIEEREKKFTLKECTNNLLREENDNLRLEEKKLKSQIDELNGAFEQYKLHFAQDGERVDMAYFLSKLRETVKLNNRIEQLEKMVEEKGYVVDIFKAECELREKERTVMDGIDAVGQVLAMLKSVLNEDEVETPRVIGKLEESLLLWQEKTIVQLNMKTDKKQIPDQRDWEVDVVGRQDSQDNSGDFEEDNSDDMTFNTAGFSVTQYGPAQCVDFAQFANDKLIRDVQVGLKTIRKEGMHFAADVNALFTQEIQEFARKMDSRDDHDVKSKCRSGSRGRG